MKYELIYENTHLGTVSTDRLTPRIDVLVVFLADQTKRKVSITFSVVNHVTFEALVHMYPIIDLVRGCEMF